jgi:hypothetical protein
MTAAEWIPINPCPCNAPIGDPVGICICESSTAYGAELAAQKRLLEYLINWNERAQGNRYDRMKSMLRQIKEAQK